MKKALLSIAVVVALFDIVLFQRSQQTIASSPVLTPTTTTLSPVISAPVGVVSAPTTSAPSPVLSTPVIKPSIPTPIVTAQFKDGTYTGNATDAFYGIMQVQTVVQNGKLSSVAILQHPSDRRNSIEINNYALPILIQEAIQAQSAQVDMVSGATASSEAFIQSLASALIKARS